MPVSSNSNCYPGTQSRLAQPDSAPRQYIPRIGTDQQRPNSITLDRVAISPPPPLYDGIEHHTLRQTLPISYGPQLQQRSNVATTQQQLQFPSRPSASTEPHSTSSSIETHRSCMLHTPPIRISYKPSPCTPRPLVNNSRWIIPQFVLPESSFIGPVDVSDHTPPSSPLPPPSVQ